MSFYRIYRYPMRVKRYRHIYFRGHRGAPEKTAVEDTGQHVTAEDENVAGILEKLEEMDRKRDENMCRARRTIRDLILCNKFDWFCTFTFNQERVNRYDFKVCQKKITQVFNNYKNRYSPSFRYIIVPEFHKDGAVHFHGMVRGIRPEDLTVPEMIWKRHERTDQLMLVKNTKGYVDWGYYSKKLGFFSCSAVKNYEKCAVYVTKYVTKDLMDLPKGQRVFMASTGLSRPELVFDMDELPMIFTPDFQNDYVALTDSESHYGLLPDWFDDLGSCSDLHDPEEPDDSMLERDIFYPRLTGRQLRLMEWEGRGVI